MLEREITTVTYQHRPVLLTEVIEQLDIKPNGVYVDGTFGRGGHSNYILRHLGPSGRLFAFDKDYSAIDYANETILDQRFSITQGSFTQIKTEMQASGLLGKVDGLFLDLGVSSPQLDDPKRGFSFMQDGPLDMRMDQKSGISAEDWINSASEQELAQVLFDFGEERFSRRIARAILRERGITPITTTKRLADLIANENPNREPGKHPATRCFQAIRIFVNQELQDLNTFLQDALDVLAPKGRLVIISFHSLEDRIVKRFLRKESSGDDYPRDLPVPASLIQPRMHIVTKAIRSSAAEIAANPRSRSAILRVGEKVK